MVSLHRPLIADQAAAARTDLRSPYTGAALSPWSNLGSDAALFAILRRQCAGWEPSLDIRGWDFREAVDEALFQRQAWMLHPCANILSLRTEAHREQREFLLAVWLMLHNSYSCGEVHLTKPVWAWTPGGGFQAEPGTHLFKDLQLLARQVPEVPSDLEIDVWSDSLGIVLGAPVPDHPIREVALPVWCEHDLAGSVKALLLSLCYLKQIAPECLAWIKPMTKVIVLLPALEGLTRNWSRQDVHGVIYTTTPHDMLEMLETVVHESAHQYFFSIEAFGPIVLDNDPAIHHSPLRPDMRPLRGIIIAWHAIVYMATLYADVHRSGTLADQRAAHRLDRLFEQHIECANTVNASPSLLTPLGDELVGQIQEVASYAFA